MIAGIDFTLKVDVDIHSPEEINRIVNTGAEEGLKEAGPILEKYAKSRSFKRKGKRGTINKIKGPYSLRYITSDLRDSITSIVTVRDLILGAGSIKVPYAGVQEAGGEVNNATLPARPFLSPVILSEENMIRDLIIDKISKRFGKS